FSAKVEQEGQNLSAGQQSQLLSLMTEERVNFKFQFDLGDPSQLNFERWDENFTDERINAYAQDMEQFNDRIAQRAQTVLNPEQAALLKSALAKDLFHSMVTIRTTKTMMAGKKP